MSTTRELYGRFRHLIHEGAKFLVVGGIGTVITFGVANALKGIGPYKAITIATILATCFTFAGNRYWTFKHRESTGNTARETSSFFVLNGIGLVIYWGCIGLWELTGFADKHAHSLATYKITYNLALVVGTALGTLFRFWSYRKWVWVAVQEAPPASMGEPEPFRALDEELAGAAEVVGRAPASHRAPNGHAPASHAPTNGATRTRVPASHRRT